MASKWSAFSGIAGLSLISAGSFAGAFLRILRTDMSRLLRSRIQWYRP